MKEQIILNIPKNVFTDFDSDKCVAESNQTDVGLSVRLLIESWIEGFKQHVTDNFLKNASP